MYFRCLKCCFKNREVFLVLPVTHFFFRLVIAVAVQMLVNGGGGGGGGGTNPSKANISIRILRIDLVLGGFFEA
jgi:hypothetical protein